MPLEEDPESFSMSFGDHLEDLRRRLLWALAVPLPLAIVLFIFSDPFIEWLYVPLDGVLQASDLPRRLQALGPAEVLVVKLKLSLVFAVVLSAPWVLWQAWLFVRPGLYRSERRFVRFLVPGSGVLTVAGVSLMYWVMLPLMLLVLVGVGTSLDLGHPPPSRDARIAQVLEAAPRIEVRASAPADPEPGDAWLLWPGMDLYVAVKPDPPDPDDPAAVEAIRVPPAGEPIIAQEFRLTTYVNFVLILLLGIVIAFQMPLVILLMGWLGLVTADQLRARRKAAIFACAVIAAVITPADAASMIIMFIPLVALFELSLVLLVAVPASSVAEGTLFRRK
jgi:sec-independent protein translocase protein TatC